MAGPDAIRTWKRREAQSSLEWIGLTLLVSALFGGLLAAGGVAPAVALVHSLSTRLLCAASLSAGCVREGSLDRSYGSELAGMVREQAPELFFGRDLLGLPVDYRTCRAAYCAEGPGRGEVTESLAGEPVTLFTRVVDCRGGEASGQVSGQEASGREEVGRGEPEPVCEGENGGSVYIQYWAYYPESASLRGAPVLEGKGYHRNDWESVQVRIGSDGGISQRASSHAGYNHSRSPANWGSDLGWGLLRGAAEELGLRERGGWGGRTGRYLIAGGSHAGNVEDRVDERTYPSHTPASRIRLVPLETVRLDPIARPARFDPITPPWEKEVWRDPESENTG